MLHGQLEPADRRPAPRSGGPWLGQGHEGSTSPELTGLFVAAELPGTWWRPAIQGGSTSLSASVLLLRVPGRPSGPELHSERNGGLALGGDRVAPEPRRTREVSRRRTRDSLYLGRRVSDGSTHAWITACCGRSRLRPDGRTSCRPIIYGRRGLLVACVCRASPSRHAVHLN
jgi:hypothetical protein